MLVQLPHSEWFVYRQFFLFCVSRGVELAWMGLVTCECTYECESCHTYDLVMSHIWMHHVAHVDESCHAYEFVMAHIWMHHIAHINESWYSHMNESRYSHINESWYSHVNESWYSHINESCYSHMNESWYSHINESCYSHMNESPLPYGCVMAHIWMSYFKHKGFGHVSRIEFRVDLFGDPANHTHTHLYICRFGFMSVGTHMKGLCHTYNRYPNGSMRRPNKGERRETKLALYRFVSPLSPFPNREVVEVKKGSIS